MAKNEKLKALRRLMKKNKLDAYIIPNTDAHQSEYIADHFKSLTWLSGFTGSAGNLVVTADFAGLWTDSRYFIQAVDEISAAGFELVKLSTPHAPEYIDWLAKKFKKKAKIGFDDTLFSAGMVEKMQAAFKGKKITLVSGSLIDAIQKKRPKFPRAPIYLHKKSFSGASTKQKLASIRKELKAKGATHHLVTMLDEVAWALNIRGKDVDFNPVAYAYLLIGQKDALLFIKKAKVSEEVGEKLEKAGVKILPYKEIRHQLAQLTPRAKVLVDKNRVNYNLYLATSHCRLMEDHNIIAGLKSIKNKTERKLIRKVMLKDGVALLRFFRWLEGELKEGRTVTECSAAEMLAQCRAEESTFVGNSFATIAGFAGNGAIVHYRPSAKTDKTLEGDGIFLLDSGGQYLDGTTDITRMSCVGTPTEQQKRDYTLVLKGHIAVARLIFPEGTKGHQLETFARQALWAEGLDYGHGTGHGVGFFLNVHEGPQSLGTGVTSNPQAGFRAGMLTSNEPGVYHTDEYGIRIENLVLTVPHKETEYGKFLRFETVTQFPIDTSLVELSLLDDAEKAWLNGYHLGVREALWPYLNDEERIWLVGKTREV